MAQLTHSSKLQSGQHTAARLPAAHLEAIQLPVAGVPGLTRKYVEDHNYMSGYINVQRPMLPGGMPVVIAVACGDCVLRLADKPDKQ